MIPIDLKKLDQAQLESAAAEAVGSDYYFPQGGTRTEQIVAYSQAISLKRIADALAIPLQTVDPMPSHATTKAYADRIREHTKFGNQGGKFYAINQSDLDRMKAALLATELDVTMWDDSAVTMLAQAALLALSPRSRYEVYSDPSTLARVHNVDRYITAVRKLGIPEDKIRGLVDALADEIDTVPRKQTSPEISALAAKYLAMDKTDIFGLIFESVETSYSPAPDEYASVYSVIDDIKKLAASCLSQDETKGQGS